MPDHRDLFDRQREFFLSDGTKSLDWRLDQLGRLERMLGENKQAFDEALGTDFKTAWFERALEIGGTLDVIAATKAQLAKWMEPEPAQLSPRLEQHGVSAVVRREPFGNCLLIAPFNAPIVLTLQPLVAILSAGNTVVLKPSETTALLAALFEQLIGRYFEPEAVAVVNGGKEEVEELLSFPFDFIFFTGSTRVGKVVMRAAAENLTPVLLELGGQNPVLVDETADLTLAAEAIIWGANTFGGQWCVSPGYVYVHETVADAFVEACKAALWKFYGADPKASPDFSRIATERDVDRLAAMLQETKVVVGGGYDRSSRYFEPTIAYPADWTQPIMASEIFGPILPILPYADLNAMIETIKRRPRSLAAYVFSRVPATVDRFVQGLSFGGGAVNQTGLQCVLTEYLPFGGVGASGLGRYYGKYGFDSLSYMKSVVISPPDVRIDPLLPPYTPENLAALGGWLGST
jgi:aldehyde dehydrogenase (NAD+)